MSYRLSSRKFRLSPWEWIVFLVVFLLSVFINMGLIHFDLRSLALFVPAKIVIDTAAVGAPITNSFYHAFAQGGEERGNMLGVIEKKIKSLKPLYIRIDHIYDYYEVVGQSNNQLTFDFSKLDATIDSIRAMGATPVLSLSYMPAEIARDRVIINPPNDWNQWALVVQKTIEHVSGKGGKNISGVYYEVWNESDHSQFGGWKPNGSKSYLTLYQYALEGAERALNVQPFKIGGPATTGLYRSWIDALARSGLRVDFFSWHSYLGSPFQYATDQKNFISWLAAYPEMVGKETLITEFGFTGSKDKRYWGSYAAAYTAAVVRQLLDEQPTYVFTFELKDGPSDGEGAGWGILTHETGGLLPKPRYSVFPFLDTMAGNRLFLTGEGSRVTGFATKNGDVIQVLLVNFNQQGAGETFPVTLTNLPSGTYELKYKHFLGTEETVREQVGGTTFQKDFYLSASGILIVEFKKVP